MQPIEPHNEQPRTDKYEAPKLVDYGTLLDLTQVGGTTHPKDIPMGHPNSAYPGSPGFPGS
jgi:hypothetical protein